MAFITIAGQNQIAKKQGDNVTLNIASFVLANVPGLGSEPETRIESIPNENVVDQLVVTKSGYVNTNQVVYSLVMGSDIGNYSFNWVGLVDDEGVLIAVTYIPLTPKTKNDGGVPGNTITRNFLLAYTGIQQTTAITVPAETWQIDFSARLSGIDERERLANFDIYGHEGFLGDGWKVTGSASTYSVAAGIGYVGGIRAKNTTVQEITTATFPNEIWLNVSLQGDISDMTAVSEFVIDTGPFEDYVDGNGITHYLTKIADIDAAGEVLEARSLFESMSKHVSEIDPHVQYLKKEENSEQLTALKKIPIYPEVLTDDNRLSITLDGTNLSVDDGQVIRLFGWLDVNTSSYQDKSFVIDLSKTYHLRFDLDNGFRLLDLEDLVYNPDQLDHFNELFDAIYSDVLIAVVDSGSATTYKNIHEIDSRQIAYVEYANNYDISSNTTLMTLSVNNEYSRSFSARASSNVVISKTTNSNYGYLVMKVDDNAVVGSFRVHVGAVGGYSFIFEKLISHEFLLNRQTVDVSIDFLLEAGLPEFNVKDQWGGDRSIAPSAIVVEVI